MEFRRSLLKGLKSCLALAALLIANTALPAIACSPAEGNYIPPTNMELVEMADVIIVGKVKGRGGEMSPSNDILVKPFALLKGEKLPEVILLDGWLVGENPYNLDYRVEAYHSDPDNIISAHPEANGGSCNRYSFAKGMKLVLFLKKNKKGFDIIAPPFTRTLEDVPSLDAPWIKAVKHYITLSRLTLKKRKQAALNISQYYDKQHYTRETAILSDLFASLSMGCNDRNELNREKCQYLWGKFDTIRELDSSTFLSRKAKPAPFEPEWPRTIAGLLLLITFYGAIIFLSFGKASKLGK